MKTSGAETKAEDQLRELMESVKPGYEMVDRRMKGWAILFFNGKITRQDYEKLCIDCGYEPISIDGFYKYGEPFPMTPNPPNK